MLKVGGVGCDVAVVHGWRLLLFGRSFIGHLACRLFESLVLL